MIKHTYQVLEYYRLLDVLAQYASCQLGRTNCLSLEPSRDLYHIDDELRLVSEIRLLLKVKGLTPLPDLRDIKPILQKSKARGSCLEPDDLLQILSLTKACRRLKEFLHTNRSLCTKTWELFRPMPGFDALIKSLNGIIASDGAIKDSASTELKKIRERKIRLRSDLQKRLENIQERAGLLNGEQQSIVTVRNGRYLISIPTEKRSRIKGIIHDYSQTKATCFFEPVAVIQDNNRMAEFIQEEKAEEFRILTDLTAMVRKVCSDLAEAQDIVGRFDGLYARGRFGEALSCVMPEIGEGYPIELKGARNPILQSLAINHQEGQKVMTPPVPVDILINEERNVLIISGPNRGGKTVTLKTLGLMSLMTQSGIHIPAEEGSRLPVFDNILADIGDEQDIQSGSSTFSAHAANLSNILEHANQRSLVIIDEPGMGTDPDEGVALAMAILDYLSGQGVSVAVSTHLNRLKSYGIMNPRTVNASVDFDVKKKEPTFILRYGSPGISHALEISRDMGIPEDILERAGKYLDKDEVRLNRLIEKLNAHLAEARRERIEAGHVKKKYHAATHKIREKLEALESEKAHLLESKRIEAENAIKEAREELGKAIGILKDRGQSVQAHVTKKYDEVSSRLMGQFDSMGAQLKPVEIQEMKPGLWVFHKRLNQKGLVQSVDPSRGRVLVSVGKAKISADYSDLDVLEGQPLYDTEEKAESVSWDIDEGPSKEINVIGYTVDDALPLIDRTIDYARIKGEISFRIIHGFGTGKLKKAIRAHLKGIPSVKNISSADAKLGGDAITVVELG
jgi:DNA mismatch repair protein MutS2